MQESTGTRPEPLRLDNVREERVHGSAAALLQDRQSQAFRGNCLLPLQVNQIYIDLFFLPFSRDTRSSAKFDFKKREHSSDETNANRNN